MLIFLMDFAAERYVEKKYGYKHGHSEPTSGSAGKRVGHVDAALAHYETERRKSTHQHLHSGDQDATETKTSSNVVDSSSDSSLKHLDSESQAERSFRQQIAAFLILEFGVIFHSVIIGLTLGSAGDEFSTLYVVIVFHQSFEGLGIGARLSAIQFPHRLRWMPYILCLAYGLTTPIAIAIGVGLATVYDSGSFTAQIVSGILDSTSAGILLYTGFVELLARDFLFNPDRTDDDKQLAFMLFSLFLGAALMALLGKWA
jgi:zinc transporter 1/2/3